MKPDSAQNPFPAEARWVWPAALGRGVNRYVEIRHPFTLREAGDVAQLHITADARYAVWLNGSLVGTGPFADWPQTRSVDLWDVGPFVRTGDNVLAVTVYELGAETASYVNAPPGVAFALRVDDEPVAVSGDTTVARWRLSPAYRAGPMPRITPQLPFTFEYDGCRDDRWTQSSYIADSDWIAFVAADGCAPDTSGRRFRQRPLVPAVLGDRVAATVIAQGLVRRADRSLGVAHGMHRDWLSSRTAAELFEEAGTGGTAPLSGKPLVLRADALAGADAAYLVIDLGSETVGYAEFEFTAPAGTLIEFSFGEHLDDLRVRSYVGGRQFASSLRATGGRQTFTYPFTRLGLRHLQLHVSDAAGFAIIYAGVRQLRYPVVERGKFASTDARQNHIHATAVNTLRLCMFDHYDDCPWREQGLYANDMLNQSLAGYYAFGEYRFPQVSLELLAGGLADDGTLELCAPGRIPITIPSFTLSWILALEANLQFSGDIDFSRTLLPVVKTVLSTWLRRSVGGLIPSLCGKRYWHFYDWTAGGLDGTVAGDCTRFAELQCERFDAPLNALFIMALAAAARLANAANDGPLATTWRQTAAEMRSRFHPTFWHATSGAYATFVGGDTEMPDRPAELTQALALRAGCCPEADMPRLRQRLAAEADGWVETSLSQSIHKFEAILEDATHGPTTMARIDRTWSDMLFRQATTFWETLGGSSDFDGAGSLCHGWSAIPAYFYGAYLLGIRPLEPGFKTFAVAVPGNDQGIGLSGTVPTPHGDIAISWLHVDGRAAVRITHPASTKPVLYPGVHRVT